MKLDRDGAGISAGANRNEKLARTFANVEQRLHAARKTHLGHPYNLSGGPTVPERMQQYFIAGQSDPSAGTHAGSDVCAEEREAMAWLMRLWGCFDLARFWGAIGASGTEGNLWGLYLGREMLPDAVVLHSADAHLSIPKAAQILRIPTVQVASLQNGEIDIADFASQLLALSGKPVIVALTCGTWMKGAHDDIAGVLSALRLAGYDRDRRYIHVDGALNAMVLPFLQDVPSGIQPSFEQEIDSLSTSGHKMIGTPMPCGALVARKAHIARITQLTAALHQPDIGLTGSRNGHAVLAVWARLIGHGYGRFAHDALNSVNRARRLAIGLAAAGVDVLHNPFSLSVVFPEPSPGIVQRYQLACSNGLAHAVVMPSVADDLLAQFLAIYTAWWRARGRLI